VPTDRILVREGDLTAMDVDAIVNAANDRLVPGGGVDGAIHRAAGPELREACAKLGGCPTGEVRVTPGFRLKARFVIHAVGPVWRGGGHGEDSLLAACYRNALAAARQRGLQAIAFPSISTGVYGFPMDRAAAIAIENVGAFLASSPAPEQVYLVCFGREAFAIHERALADHAKGASP
jgi:O-acetyl-ADP-ribose deacetylase